MSRKITQCEKIALYMNKHGSITPLDAFREFGCMRLAARIADLKDKYSIGDCMESYKNENGEVVRYKRYFLREEKDLS